MSNGQLLLLTIIRATIGSRLQKVAQIWLTPSLVMLLRGKDSLRLRRRNHHNRPWALPVYTIGDKLYLLGAQRPVLDVGFNPICSRNTLIMELTRILLRRTRTDG